MKAGWVTSLSATRGSLTLDQGGSKTPSIDSGQLYYLTDSEFKKDVMIKARIPMHQSISIHQQTEGISWNLPVTLMARMCPPKLEHAKATKESMRFCPFFLR